MLLCAAAAGAVSAISGAMFGIGAADALDTLLPGSPYIPGGKAQNQANYQNDRDIFHIFIS